MPVILYKELSYKIVGILFEVFKQIGGDYQEKYYQRALEQLLKKSDISYQREVMFDIVIEDTKIGRHFIDFVINHEIALDLKRGNNPRMADIKQMLMYLKTSNLQLGILAYFGSDGVKIKRIVNKHYQDS